MQNKIKHGMKRRPHKRKLQAIRRKLALQAIDDASRKPAAK